MIVSSDSDDLAREGRPCSVAGFEGSQSMVMSLAEKNLYRSVRVSLKSTVNSTVLPLVFAVFFNECVGEHPVEILNKMTAIIVVNALNNVPFSRIYIGSLKFFY